MNTDRSSLFLPWFNWWITITLLLVFWLSSSIIIDLVIMPSLSATGMMDTEGFASAGYLIFGVFNRLELLSAAVVLAGFLAFTRNHILTKTKENLSIILAALLLVIVVVYTYILTPEMAGWAMNLNLFQDSEKEIMPQAMANLQQIYWFLEVIKMGIIVTLLRWIT
ncbi:MAG: hypothetical protein D6756_03365, partial [Cyanobacteria bacterium J083]